MNELNQKPKVSRTTTSIPPLRWKPTDIEPDMDKLMDFSTRFCVRNVISKAEEMEFFKSLDLDRLKQWEEQADNALEFYLMLKASITFMKGVYITNTYFTFVKGIWDKANKAQRAGGKAAQVGYDLVLKRAQYGISAYWYRVKFWGQKGNRIRGRKYVGMSKEVETSYNKESFYAANPKEIRDYIYYSIECNLAVLREQTKDLSLIARGLKQYKTHGLKLFQDHQKK